MKFRKIWFDGTTVRLSYQEALAGATDKHEWECSETPTRAFRNALEAFSPVAVKLLGLPLEWADCEVRSLSLKEEEKGVRGLQVTVMRKIPAAKNRPVVITTPYLSAPQPEYNGDGFGYLDGITLALIAEVEAEAEAYRGGERGEQTSLPLGDSPNSKAAGDRMASAETRSTRKPKKNRDFIPGVGDVVNADAAVEDITDDQVRQLLMMVERDVPVDAIGKWTSSERTSVISWAKLRQRELANSLKPKEIAAMPKEPTVIKASATLPLGLAKTASESGKSAATLSRTVQ